MAGISSTPIKQTTPPTMVWTKDGATKSNSPKIHWPINLKKSSTSSHHSFLRLDG